MLIYTEKKCQQIPTGDGDTTGNRHANIIMILSPFVLFFSYHAVITIVKRGCRSDQQWVSLGAQYTTTIQCLVLYRTVCGTTFQAHNNIYTVSYSVISGSTLVTALCTYSPVQIYSWWGGGKRVEKKANNRRRVRTSSRARKVFYFRFFHIYFFPLPRSYPVRCFLYQLSSMYVRSEWWTVQGQGRPVRLVCNIWTARCENRE